MLHCFIFCVVSATHIGDSTTYCPEIEIESMTEKTNQVKQEASSNAEITNVKAIPLVRHQSAIFKTSNLHELSGYPYY